MCVMKIEIIQKDVKKTVECEKGDNLLNVLVGSGFYVPAACGGKGKCRKCAVIVALKNGERFEVLSCEYSIEEEITVTVPEVRGGGVTDFSIAGGLETDKEEGFGVALDIGTTTLAAYLVDLKTGAEFGRYSCLNPQGSLGADVISRISACGEGKLGVLNSLIKDKVREILVHFKTAFKIDVIKRLCVCGNTTMLHIFAGEDPTPMGKAPFTPAFLNERRYSGGEFSLPAEEIVLLPSVSAYVGSDITAGIIALGLDGGSGNRLLVDVGTNGEIALSTGGRLLCCSTAAGPAFEGASISCGMGGVDGAISSVTFKDGKVDFKTVSGEPKGICGSGLIDLTSELVRHGVIDETGAFSEEEGEYGAATDEGYELTDGVTLTGRDVREIQLAKSAVCAGIKTLIKESGLDYGNIDKLYVAGGLGFYLNKANACAIGLLPVELENKIEAVGNSGGAGAKMCLVSRAARERASKAAADAEISELADSPVFMEEYIENMTF